MSESWTNASTTDARPAWEISEARNSKNPSSSSASRRIEGVSEAGAASSAGSVFDLLDSREADWAARTLHGAIGTRDVEFAGALWLTVRQQADFGRRSAHVEGQYLGQGAFGRDLAGANCAACGIPSAIPSCRACAACHESADGSQVRNVTWEYSDPGAMPFNGSHRVRADSKGLFIENIRSETIEPEDGFKLSAFAPWIYLGDSWKIQGDFALPQLKERKLYEQVRKEPALGRARGVVHN